MDGERIVGIKVEGESRMVGERRDGDGKRGRRGGGGKEDEG